MGWFHSLGPDVVGMCTLPLNQHTTFQGISLTFHIRWGSAVAIGDGSALKAGPKPKTVIKAANHTYKVSTLPSPSDSSRTIDIHH